MNAWYKCIKVCNSIHSLQFTSLFQMLCVLTLLIEVLSHSLTLSLSLSLSLSLPLNSPTYCVRTWTCSMSLSRPINLTDALVSRSLSPRKLWIISLTHLLIQSAHLLSSPSPSPSILPRTFSIILFRTIQSFFLLSPTFYSPKIDIIKALNSSLFALIPGDLWPLFGPFNDYV